MQRLIANYLSAILTLVLATADANASFVDGNRLHQMCNGDPPLAAMFIAGVSDFADEQHRRMTLATAGLKEDIPPMAGAFIMAMSAKACMPSQATLGQAKDVVCNYLRDKPAERHRDGATLAASALVAAFPCSAK